MRQFILIGLGIAILAGIAAYGVVPIFVTMRRDNASVTQEEWIIRSGSIEGTATHPASGKVHEIHKENGDRLIRFEGYSGVEGSDLHAYLSKDLEKAEAVDLGPIDGMKGDFEYTVPKKSDIGDYRYVLVWSESLDSVFNSADLGATE